MSNCQMTKSKCKVDGQAHQAPFHTSPPNPHDYITANGLLSAIS